MALKISNELKEKLGADTVALLEAASKDSDLILGVAANYITKTRFDEVNTQLGESKATNTKLTKDLTAATKGAKTQEELTATIEKLTADNEAAKTKYEADIAARERSYLVDQALSGSKPKNLKAVKGLLNLDDVQVKDGKLVGLDTQLEALKKSDSYLFEAVKEQETKLDQFGNPITGGGGSGKTTTDEVNDVLALMGFEDPSQTK